MVKAYLRYEALGNVGVISSSGLTFDSSGEILFTGTLESVTAWHARKGLSVCSFLLVSSTAISTEGGRNERRSHRSHFESKQDSHRSWVNTR